ncbi:hypothetical protein ACMCOU_000923, partial [Campylobacter coli]
KSIILFFYGYILFFRRQIGATMEAFIEYSDKYLQDDITALKISWRFCAIRLKFDSALLQLQDINKIV